MYKAYPQVETLRAQLAELGSDYICNTRLPDTTVSVSFLGQLQGQTVVWNMTLATLAHYRLAEVDVIPTIEPGHFSYPFIEIQEGVEGVYPLRVGLDLAVIDEPVIKKTLIMIRNYKRLVIGRIEFAVTDT